MKFRRREKGQGLVEYALLLVLIAVVVLGVLVLLGPQISSVYSRIISNLGGTVPHTYTITGGPTITASYSSGICQYSLTMQVRVTDGGSPVSGEAVSVSVNGGPAAGSPPSTTTNASGIASWSNVGVKNAGGLCQSGTSTVSVANGAVTRSVHY